MSDELRKAAQELLVEYDAQRFVSIFHTQIEALRAALQSCHDCGKPTPPDSVCTCLPQKPDDWEGIAADQALTIAMLQLDKQCLLEGLQYAVKQVPSMGDVPGIRSQLAAVPDSDAVCEWTEDEMSKVWTVSCEDEQLSSFTFPQDWMTFCHGCGKRIRFIEGKNNGS